VADRIAPVAHYAPVVARRQWLASRSDGQRLHAGIDLAAAPGTVVSSPEAGRVVLVQTNANGTNAWRGYGPAVVIIEGASGLFHRLTHLADEGILVRPGDILASAGVPVGRISSLAHTHWEVMTRPRRTEPYATVELSLDPLAWIVGELVQYDPARHPCAPHPGRTARTPRACRVGYRGSLAPAPGPRGGSAVPIPIPTRAPVADTSAPMAPPSRSSRFPSRSNTQTENGGFLWLALAVIVLGSTSGRRN